MPKFGERSTTNLNQSHPDLQLIFNEVIKYYDCSVICGYRGQYEQDAAYHSGKSTLKYPKSKHNQQPSLAVDVCPYPIDWNDRKRFYFLAGLVKGIAIRLKEEGKIKNNIRWGGDWDGDGDFKDQKFDDLPHFELTF